MIGRLLDWIGPRRRADASGYEALRGAQARLAAESDRTAAARELGRRARDSRQRNNYASALRAAYYGRPR